MRSLVKSEIEEFNQSILVRVIFLREQGSTPRRTGAYNNT